VWYGRRHKLLSNYCYLIGCHGERW